MLAKPVGKRILGERASRQVEDRLNCILSIEKQFMAVDTEEKASENPCCALVSVPKRMITSDSESVGRSELGRIIFTISPLIDGPR